jgi:hypothetical protein
VQVDLFAAQRDLTVNQQIRVAQVRGEYRVVVLRRGAQQQRPRLLEQQLELREYAGIAMIEALGIAEFAADVATMVEHRKSVAMFQGSRTALLQVRIRRNGELRSDVIGRVDRRFRAEQSRCVHARLGRWLPCKFCIHECTHSHCAAMHFPL